MRLWALVSAGWLFCYAILTDSVPLVLPAIAVAIINLHRLRGLHKTRTPTRVAREMDDDEKNRVDDIRAQSRYSSAGIEF